MDCFCSPAACFQTLGALPHSSRSQTAPLRFKKVSTAATAASTFAAMRTSRISISCGEMLPTLWLLFAGLCRAWGTSLKLRAAQLHCSWAYAEATTRKHSSTACSLKMSSMYPTPDDITIRVSCHEILSWPEARASDTRIPESKGLKVLNICPFLQACFSWAD